jgi:hypothetical protein
MHCNIRIGMILHGVALCYVNVQLTNNEGHEHLIVFALVMTFVPCWLNNLFKKNKTVSLRVTHGVIFCSTGEAKLFKFASAFSALQYSWIPKAQFLQSHYCVKWPWFTALVQFLSEILLSCVTMYLCGSVLRWYRFIVTEHWQDQWLHSYCFLQVPYNSHSG